MTDVEGGEDPTADVVDGRTGVVRRGVDAVNAALAALGALSLRSVPPSDFFTAPESIPAERGTLLRTEPARFYIDPLRLVPAPARVTRIMFASTDRHDVPIALTGTVLTPTRPRSKRPDRGLVAFAVGTQGMGSQCAPSRQMALGREYESLFISGLLARGYNVVVPDYQGLGLDGVHTYMSREVQGRTVLDALRAAQQLEYADIPATGPVAITGYSQGGAAAASAAEIATEYAPELDLRGVVAAAVPADMQLIARFLDGSPYFAFLAYALVGLGSDYDLDLAALLNDRGKQILERVGEQCMFESLRSFAFLRSSSLTADGRSISRILRDPEFAPMVAEQLLGNGRRPDVDVMLTHSRLDDIVPYESGRALAERWASQGARVRLQTTLAPTHAAAAVTSYPAAFGFLQARFAGRKMRANTSRYLHSLAEPETAVPGRDA